MHFRSIYICNLWPEMSRNFTVLTLFDFACWKSCSWMQVQRNVCTSWHQLSSPPIARSPFRSMCGSSHCAALASCGAAAVAVSPSLCFWVILLIKLFPLVVPAWRLKRERVWGCVACRRVWPLISRRLFNFPKSPLASIHTSWFTLTTIIIHSWV